MAIVKRHGKLIESGGYRGLEEAVGKTFEFTKFLGHWNLDAESLLAVGAHPVMKEYAFMQREIQWHQLS